MSKNNFRVEIWEAPRNMFSPYGSGDVTVTCYTVDIRNNTKAVWIPEIAYDFVSSINNLANKPNVVFKGYANSSINFAEICKELQIPSIENIKNMVNVFPIENINGVTEEEILSKYKLSELTGQIIRLTMQVDYYQQIIDKMSSNDVVENNDSTKKSKPEKSKSEVSSLTVDPNIINNMKIKSSNTDSVKVMNSDGDLNNVSSVSYSINNNIGIGNLTPVQGIMHPVDEQEWRDEPELYDEENEERDL